MKEFRFRIVLVLAAIVLALYLLYPTYADYQNSQEVNKILDEKKQEFITANPDLTKTQLDKMLEVVEDSILSADREISKTRENRVKLGLDLQGGMRVVLEVNTSQLLSKLAKNPDDDFDEILKEAQDLLGRMIAKFYQILKTILKMPFHVHSRLSGIELINMVYQNRLFKDRAAEELLLNYPVLQEKKKRNSFYKAQHYLSSDYLKIPNLQFQLCKK
jgi:hypothetical protein